jgi:hypothetical protein
VCEPFLPSDAMRSTTSFSVNTLQMLLLLAGHNGHSWGGQTDPFESCLFPVAVRFMTSSWVQD